MEDSLLESYEPMSHNQTLKQIIMPVEEVSIMEKLKLRHKPTCTIRRVKTKGALLVLAWNLLAAGVFWYTVTFYLNVTLDLLIQKLTASAVLCAITLPVAGWLADTCIGRYRAIYYSSLILWAATIIITTNTVIHALVSSYDHISPVIVQIAHSAMGIGISGFLSTIIQFGIDQLYDASTNEVSAFIMWYMWTCSCPSIILNLTSYIQQYSQYFTLVGQLLLCASLSLILVSMFCCSNWLIKEPISQNPFKLIYRVTKYAIKNKYPQNRSAFTYCEDEVISRIDYGKSKYGGPFTIEQVEDVKMFFKTLPIVVLGGILAGEMMAANILSLFLQFQFVLPHHNQEMQYRVDFSISHIIPSSTPVLILLNELFLYPIFHRCCSCVTSLHKFFVGMMINIVTFLALMTFEILSRKAYFQANGYNATISCVFYQDQALATTFNYNWMVLPDCLFVLSITLICIAGMEFIFAQVPYTMKGIILGVAFCSSAFSIGFNIALIIPLKQRILIWGTGIISCGFWYALVHIIFCTIGCIAIAIITKHYTKRKREDILPNEHIFAERYYSNQ